MPRFALVLCSLCFLPLATRGEDKPEPTKATPNRLARESSPYLLQHAHNPVDWFPWGDEAFAKAKKEGKLVFLSIGYSSCHWCHVMEKESFMNADIAKLMNESFVCIKVDREERPDVDHVYMEALNVFAQQGGWPLSMFLTADGKPIIGGTYWPPEDKELGGQKVRGFKTVLTIVQKAWKEEQKAVLEQADDLAKKTALSLEGVVRGAALLGLDRSLITSGVEEVMARFDKEYGGFGSPARGFRGPKFPLVTNLSFILDEASRSKSKELNEIISLSLDRMARGGIYDHLGGGFARYTVERTWLIPHFEKMLYDNAQLVELYSRAYATTKNEQYQRVVRETLRFVQRELTSPDGAFYSALDADSEGEEGKFYIWSDKELNDLLGKDAEFFRGVYGIEKPNFEEKHHILSLPKPLSQQAAARKLTEAQLEERLAPLRDKLFDVRAKRERPLLDTKVLTAWNGQMIGAYALAGKVFDDKEYLVIATRAADFLLKKLRTKDDRLLRTYGAAPKEKPQARLNAYLDDYAFLVHGLLNLHDATGEKRWLVEATALTDKMIELYGDAKVGGFFYTSNDHEKLFARGKDQFDGAQPCGNSVAAKNLVRLWQKTKEDKYREQAEKSFKAFGATIKTQPSSVTTMLSALGMYLDAQKK
jgi:uncharacterized protein YyaL (SSP411 family)